MADPQQFSAQDLVDLRAIHNALPDGDPRKAKVMSLLGSTGQRPLDPQAMAAQAMQRSGINTPVPMNNKVVPQELQGQPNLMTRFVNSPLGAPVRFQQSVAEDVPPALSGMAQMMSAGMGSPTAQSQVMQGIGSLMGSDAPTREKAGTLLGVNVEDLKRRSSEGDLAGSMGKAVLPLSLLKAFGIKEMPSGNPDAALASTLTKGATESIPAVVKETRPALMAEAQRIGIKPSNINSVSDVVNSLDSRLQDVFNQVKSRANPTNPDIPGQQIVTETMNRIDKKFPYLQQARPQVRQAILDDLTNRFGNKDFSIDSLDAERRAVNNEHASLLAKKQVTLDQAMKDPELASGAMAGDAVRDVLYNELGRRTGEDMKGLKQQQSNLATLRRQLTIQKTDLPNQQANYEATPYAEKVANQTTAYGAAKEALLSKTGVLSPEAKVNRRIKAGFKP